MLTEDLTMPTPQFSGSVDYIGHDRIYGWLALGNGEPGRGWVSIVVNGVTLRGGDADLYREDLLGAGVGDGCAGYDFVFGPGELPEGCTVAVYGQAGQRGEGVLLAERALDGRPVEDDEAVPAMQFQSDEPDAGGTIGRSDVDVAESLATEPQRQHQPVLYMEHARPADSASTCVHIDVTDLLFYLWHVRNVSGIQRVQCGYIANLLRTKDAAVRIRFCVQAPGHSTYADLPSADMRYLMQEMHSSRIPDFKDWQAYIGRLRAVDTKPAAAFERGDILLVMGAPWIYPEYFRAIAEAKSRHGVRYFQISYDMIPSFLPEHCDANLVVGFNAAVAGILRYADHVFAISNYSVGDFVKFAHRCGVAVPPLSVIPMGGTIDYNETAGERETLLSRADDRSLDGFFRRHRLGEFVLCVGTLESRKNHAYLYQVWKRLTEANGANTPKLVLVGRLGWHIELFQRFLRTSNSLNGRIVHITEVSDRELQELYRRALFTVFPSLYEGWGLPVGESLDYGKLPVASGVTSMPEVGLDWALYIDPFNIDDGFRQINELVNDRAKLQQLEQRIVGEYEPLSWHAAAQQFLQQLTTLAEVPVQHMEESPTAVGPLLELGTLYDIGDLIRRREVSEAEDTVRNQMRVFALREILEGDDWYDPEPWGIWSNGDTARLCFRLDPAMPRPSLAYVAVWLPGWYPDTFCSITVNGIGAGRIMIPSGGRTRHLRIAVDPADLVNGVIQIALTIDRVVQQASNENDPRFLGLGVKSIFLCHQDDFETRLSYLEDRASA